MPEHRLAALAHLVEIQAPYSRRLSVPLRWYPRLHAGTPAQRNHWEPCAAGRGIHWPDLDEDLSIEGLLAGRKDPASQM